MKKIFLLSVISFLLFSADASAGKRYWVAAAHATWNNTANWSTTSGGGSGASVPGSTDTAYFDSGGNFNDTLDVNVSVKRLEIAATYTATIVQGAKTVTIGTSGAVLSGGTFAGGSATITLTGAVTISGCAFTSTSGTFSTNSNFTYSSGSFTHNSGLVKYTATSTITGSINLHNLEFAATATATFTIASGTTLTVAGNLTVSGSGGITLNTGNISAQGNVTFSNTSGAGGGNAIITINGSGTQTLTGHATTPGLGYTPSIVINKTASDTLKLVGYISVDGNWTHTLGIVAEGSSIVFMVSTKTISGSMTFNGLWFGGGGTFTISSGTTLTAVGVNIGGASVQVLFNTGDLHITGNLINTNVSGSSGGTATFTFDGTGTQTITGGSNPGNARLPNVVINKTSGTLNLVGFISAGGNWTYTSGTINPGASSLWFAGTKTISGSHTLNNAYFGAGTYTISSGTVLSVNEILDFSGTSAIVLNTGEIDAYGNISTSNTHTSTGGSAKIKIVGDSNQTFTGSGTAGQGKLPNITIDKDSGTLALASIISCTGNWIYTKGTVSSGSSGVVLYGTFNLDGQGSSSTMSFYRVQIASGTRTLTGNLDCNDNLSILSGATCSASSYTINIGGNFLNQGTWTYGTSTVVFDGANYNKIQQTSGTITFANVVFNRRAGKSVTLANKVSITTSATFSCGRVKTTATNVLEFADNATCTVSNNDSAYVHGPVLKIGNDAFTFPLGDTTLHDSIAYHPLKMTAPSSATDQFRSTYYATGQSLGSATVDSLTGLSAREYWTLERLAGSSAVTVGLSWNRNSPPSSVSDLRVAAWNSTASAWGDLGKAEVIMSWPTGMYMASATTTFNSNVATLAPAYLLPKNKGYATVKRKLDGGFYEVNTNALYFRFDDEYNDQSHNLEYHIYNAANTDVAPTLVPTTNNSALSVYGDNRFKIDLYTSTAVLSAGYYILEVRNEKNEPFYLRFKMN